MTPELANPLPGGVRSSAGFGAGCSPTGCDVCKLPYCLHRAAIVQAALDQVWGVDLNPMAVAICRFRLTLAAMHACGVQKLKDAPPFVFHVHVGDSLGGGPAPTYSLDQAEMHFADALAAGRPPNGCKLSDGSCGRVAWQKEPASPA